MHRTFNMRDIGLCVVLSICFLAAFRMYINFSFRLQGRIKKETSMIESAGPHKLGLLSLENGRDTLEGIPSCPNMTTDEHSWEILVETTSIFKKLDAPWSLFAGTMLEFARDCKIGTSDLDILIDFKWWRENKEIVFTSFKEKGYDQYYTTFEHFGSFKSDDWSYSYPWRKVGSKSSMKVDLHSGFRVANPSSGYFWALYTEPRDHFPSFRYFYSFFSSSPWFRAHRCFSPMEGFVDTQFGSLSVRIPYPVEPYLEAMYGSNWRQPYEGWKWDVEPFTIGNCKKSISDVLPPPDKDDRFSYSCAKLVHVPEEFATSPWFLEFATLLASQKERAPCPLCTREKESEPDEWACFRFWHSTPHFNYHFKEPRSTSWEMQPKFSQLATCSPLKQEKVMKSEKCLKSLRPLFDLLDGVIHHPLSGTELGFARIGKDADDSDIDLFVDVPPEKLASMLKSLNPRPSLSGSGYTAELHWKPPDCSLAVHMQFNDRIADEMGERTVPSDLCQCMWKSISGYAVTLHCHKKARQRMNIQYGPTWWMPLKLKQSDMPYWSFKHQSHTWSKQAAVTLRNMRKSGSNLITFKDLPEQVPSDVSENLVLAQLNLMLFWVDSNAFRSPLKSVFDLIARHTPASGQNLRRDN